MRDTYKCICFSYLARLKVTNIVTYLSAYPSNKALPFSERRDCGSCTKEQAKVPKEAEW